MKLIRKSSSNGVSTRRSAALVTIASYCFSSCGVKGAFHTTSTGTTSLNLNTLMPTTKTISTALSSVRSSSSISSTSTSKHNHNDGLMPDMLQRIRACNQIPTDIKFLDFVVKDQIVGKVTLDMALRFSQSPIFELVLDEENEKEKKVLTLTSDAGTTSESRTKSIMKVMKELKEEGIIQGWRDELYSVSTSFYDTQKEGEEPLFLMERAAVWTLGILQYGVHINGLVSCQSPDKNKEPKMWIARRSKTKSKYPGMLDHIVAGGQPFGLSLLDNVIKECFEEAGVPEELVRQNLRSAGVISYENYYHVEGNYGGLERAVLFNYDLYLPPDFKPKVVDGEVDEFMLWDLDQVRESIRMDYHDPIKPNCYLVIIDFLMRFGYFGDNEKDGPDSPFYLDIFNELRGGDCR